MDQVPTLPLHLRLSSWAHGGLDAIVIVAYEEPHIVLLCEFPLLGLALCHGDFLAHPPRL
jgi:hypothetical protein